MAKKPNIQVVRPIGAKPTPEELKSQQEAQALRAYIQHRESLAQGILFNALHGGSGTRIGRGGSPDYKPAVKAAIEAADCFMEEIYGKQYEAVKPAEEEKKEGE